MIFGLFSCKDSKKDIVFDKFKAQIENAGLKIDSIDSEGLIHISKDSIDLKISLDNTRRIYARDKNDSCIADLVKTIINYSWKFPDLDLVKNEIYLSLFPSDFDFKDFLHTKITDDFSKVYLVRENGKLSWITKKDIENWKVSESDIENFANLNGDRLLESATLKYEIIENKKLGYFETNDETLKASLLFSTKLKTKVKDLFGWPIYAVIPVRDFCYIFSEKDFDFFSQRLGQTVIKEYNESGYPVTTELLKFTDSGVEVYGKYDNKTKK
jgi:hypothetical protein